MSQTPLAIIENTIKAPETETKLMLSLGYVDENDNTGRSEARRYANSVLMEIQKTAGDDKKDLTKCSPVSIVRAMVDAASFKLPIDGRGLAYLVKYGNAATFMPGYKGYLYKIKQAYPDADFTVETIFDGDDVKIWSENGVDQFTFKKADAFAVDLAKFKGVLFAVTYTDGGRLIRKVRAVTKERIDRARKAAKQDFVWASDYFEKAKGAAIKAACKHMFTALQGLQDMIRVDNENNYDVDRAIDPANANGIVDNLNKGLDTVLDNPPQPAADDGVIDVDYTRVDEGDDTAPPAPEPQGPTTGAAPQDIQDLAEKIRAVMRDTTTVEALERVWDTTHAADIERIKTASEPAYKFLSLYYDKHMAKLGGRQ